MFLYERPKGFRDILPLESEKIEYVKNEMIRIIRRFGYSEVKPPTVEYFDLFLGRSGPEIERSMFTFVDKGGKKLALRPDFTTPIARIYASRSAEFKQPVRWYYYGSAFRYEEPQSYRYREFYTVGVELIGSPRMEADLEVLTLLYELLNHFDLDFLIKINDISLLKSALKTSNLSYNQIQDILILLDKKGKMPTQKLKRDLALLADRYGLEEKMLNFLFSMLDMPTETSNNVRLKLVTNLTDMTGRDSCYLCNLYDLCSDLGIADRILVEPPLSRGLVYYTSLIFEAYIKGYKLAVAAGGRYDQLIRICGGPNTPAVGFGVGIDRVLGAIEKTSSLRLGRNKKIFLAIATHDITIEGLKLAMMLRRSGFHVETEVMGRKLKSQLSYASNKGMDYVIILGRSELREGKVRLRNMANREEIVVPIDQLPNLLR